MNVSMINASVGVHCSASNREPFLYSVHGFTVASDFFVSELRPGSGRPDVRIRAGTVPQHLEAPQVRGVLFEAARDQYLLRIAGVAGYLARAGDEIIVEPADGADPSDVCALLFGSPFSALLHQRGVLLLHAGGVVGAKGAVLIAGHSGRGKSTAVAGLAKRGYWVLADDAAVVTHRPESDSLLVEPGGQQIKLWLDAAHRLGHETEGLDRVRSGLEKYAVPVWTAASEATALAAIFVLETHNQRQVEVDVLEHSAKFEALRTYTRIVRAMDGLGNHVAHFRIASAVAARVPIVRIRRPRGLDSQDEVLALIEPALR